MKISIMKVLMVMAVLALAAVFSLPAAHANLISNGSFESGDDPGSFTTVNAGGTNITDWSVTAGSVDYIGTYWTASNLDRSIDMNGYFAAGAIEQTFTTVAGQTYRVTFDLAGNPDSGPTIKNLLVASVGPNQTFSFDITGRSRGDMGWVTKSFDFVASGSSTTLHFEGTETGGAYGPALDNVDVSGVPLPATVLLLGSGLVGLVGWRRLKKG